MQQINLYLPEFQPNREPLRSIHMFWGLVLFALLLVVVALLGVNNNRTHSAALEQQKTQLEQLKIQVTQLQQQRPDFNLAQMDAEIASLQQELQRREQILSVISNQKLGNNRGFSAHLQAFGQQSLDTLSLAAIALQQGGNYVEFAGQASAADQVPLYIQRLRTEPVLADSAFGVLNINPARSATGVFDFSLAKEARHAEQADSKTAVQRLLELNEQAAKANQAVRGDR